VLLVLWLNKMTPVEGKNGQGAKRKISEFRSALLID
jgi:hypothetical protein